MQLLWSANVHAISFLQLLFCYGNDIERTSQFILDVVPLYLLAIP